MICEYEKRLDVSFRQQPGSAPIPAEGDGKRFAPQPAKLHPKALRNFRFIERHARRPKSQNESLSESIAALSKIETQESKTPTRAHSRLKVARSDP